MRRRRNPEIIGGRVAGNGSIISMSEPDAFTVQRTSAGVYTITFPSNFKLIALSPVAAAGGFIYVNTLAYSEHAVTVGVVSGGANADSTWGFTAIGIQQ